MKKDSSKEGIKRPRAAKGMGSYRHLKNGKVQWRQRIDGEERYLTANTMKELQARVSQVVDLPIIKEKVTVDEWFCKWLETYIKPLKKDATYKQYKFVYTSHIKPEIGKRKLVSVKPFDIQHVIAIMNTKHLERKDKAGNVIWERDGASTWTMKHARKIMNIAFSEAVKNKYIAINPVKDISIPKKQAKPRKTLTLEELAKLYKGLEKSRWIWSAKFMMVTGLRRGELLALKWSDIDNKNKRITVDESNSTEGLGDTKNSKIHYVPLSKTAIKYLEAQKRMLKKEKNPILYNAELKKTDIIFPNKNGSMLNPNSYFTVFYRAAKNVGIKASPHCLRHTFVFMNRKRLSLSEIQSILGHDESTQTLDMYGDMINDTLDKTAEQIDDTFLNIESDMEKVLLESEEEEKKKMGKVIQLQFKKA